MSFFARSFRPATQAMRMSARQLSTSSAGAASAAGVTAGAATAVAAGGAGYYMMSGESKPASASASSFAPDATSSLASQTQDLPKTFPGKGLTGFVTLELESSEALSHNVKRLRFKLPSDQHVSGIPAGSAALLKHKDPSWWFPALRPYSPVTTTGEQGHVDFVIKAYAGGALSPRLHALRPGDTVDVRAPLPGYAYRRNEHRHVLLIAGGTGITPLYGLLRAILADPADTTAVTLLYGNQSERDVVLKDEIEALRARFPDRLRVAQTLTQPPPDWFEGVGQIDRKFIEDAAPKPSEDVKVFVCGPPAMYKAVAGGEPRFVNQGKFGGILQELGYTKEQVHKF